MKIRKIMSIALVLLLVVTGFALAQKKFAGKTIRLLYFSATYADAAKEYAKEFEDDHGCEGGGRGFPLPDTV